MRRCRVLFCLLFALAAARLLGGETASSIHEMLLVLDRTEPTRHHPFALTGSVYQVGGAKRDAGTETVVVIDDGQLLISAFTRVSGLKPGDVIAASGFFGLQKQSYGNEPYVVVQQAKAIGRAPDIRPVPRRLQDLSSQDDNLRLVETSGSVIDYRPDEADPEFLYLILKDGPTTMPVSVPVCDKAFLDRLIDAQVSVVGTFNRTIHGIRRYARPAIVSRLQDITVIAPPPQDVPSLERKIYLTPKDVLSLGKRKACGEIIAVWQSHNLLLRDDDGRIVRVRLSRRNETTPRPGLRTTAFGYPETDQFNIILGAATISPCTADTRTEPAPARPRPLTDVTALNPRNHGELVTLAGTIRSLPSLGNAEGRIGLDCGGHLVPLDASSCPEAAEGLQIGCLIEATGVCLLEMSDYDSPTETPHVSGLTLVLRDRDDIVVRSRPPWLTSTRFLVILAVLLAVLIAILLWNVSLRILVERRGRELARHESEAIKARFKTVERTRLAAELHDSVVQNLTGAALEIRAAQVALPEPKDGVAPHLDIALKTINSSRAELRNCIWDLRNSTLEEKDVDEAIRLTLQPHTGDADLQIRFNVPRRKIPDNEFHGILCIIRELVVNAVRHGHARSVKVAGTLEQDRILFSVSDNGCGFDPAARPGMEQGHFGLEGVMERAKALNGEVTVTSAPGQGARIAVNIALLEEL